MTRTKQTKNKMTDKNRFGSLTPKHYQKFFWWGCNHKTLPQTVRQKLRKKIANKFAKGPFDVVCENIKFRIYPNQNYCDRFIMSRNSLPEKKERNAIRPLLKKGMVFVDVGANVGAYSTFVSQQCGGELTLVSVEPHPITFKKLSFNLRVNNAPMEYVMNCGVGEKNYVTTLWSDGGSNIGRASVIKAKNSAEEAKISIKTLKQICQKANIKKIDLLKVDVEGYEDKVIIPFIQNVSDDFLPKNILIETEHSQAWGSNLISELVEKKYKQINVTNQNTLFQKN